ncbi:hypothetical protein NliqN6_1996 [Naganishia liquefaciens]|uniref:DNA polymerase V n=1 Tax=Naganishia liquefaciens TaxID=104408 RepID=A0A8H3TST3_9TREE|nr:hypothetical protein NliqN6_1996 [Naganishia liquefaciens]
MSTTNVLPLFWHLSSTDRSVRLDATESLISSLEDFQAKHVEPENPTNGDQMEVDHSNGSAARGGTDTDEEEESGDDDDNEDDESGVEVDASDDETNSRPLDPEQKELRRLDARFEKDNSEDVRYSIKRLVRGLTSSRESSRLGFAVALTELLTRITTLSPAHVISLIQRVSQTSKAMRGQEERDAYFGRLFGTLSIIDSRILFSSAATLTDFKTCIGELFTLGDKKSWLRESTWWTVIRAVRMLLKDDVTVEWKEAAIDGLITRVYGKPTSDAFTAKSHGAEWTQEKVALTLVLQSARPKLMWKALLAPTFKNGNLLSHANLPVLGKILKETNDAVDSSAQPNGAPSTGVNITTGSWKPQLHFVWEILLDAYFAQDGFAAIAEKTPFQDFFKAVVDDTLFSPSSTPQRKFWGFEIFSKVLPLLPKEDVPLIFSQNFMKCWMNHLSSEDRYLHKAALKLARELQEITKSNPLVGFTLISQLVGRNGSQNFDKLTKTKTVEGIMANLDASGVTSFATYLRNIAIGKDQGPEIDAAKTTASRTWVFDQLLALIKNPSVPKEDSWIASVLEFLMVNGLFIVTDSNSKSSCHSLHTKPRPAFDDKVAAECRNRFFAAIMEMTVQNRVVKGDDTKSQRITGTDASGKLWLSRCLEWLEVVEKDKSHATAVVDVDKEILKGRKHARATLARLHKEKTLSDDVAKGAEILISFALLQTYDDELKSYELLEDVQQCIESLLQPAASSSTKEAAPPALDLLVDVLLAYLDKASSDYKALATVIFTLVSSKATKSTIEHLVAQLEQVGGGYDSDEDEEDLEDGSDKDEDADMEEDSDGESDGDEDDDLANGDVDPEFRRKIAEALQVAGMANAGDEEQDGDEGDSEEDEDDADSIAMDDDQMLALDEKLAAIFKSQKTSKQDNNNTESVHFKLRVLDLVEAYMRKQSSNPLIFDFIPILLELAKGTGNKEQSLASKAAGILNKRFDKMVDIPIVTESEAAREILQIIHSAAITAPTKEFARVCSHCSIAVAKAVAQAPSETVSSENDPVLATYRETLKTFMTKKSTKLPESFLAEFLQRQPEQAWALREDLLRYAGKDSINAYHQLSAFTLLTHMAKQLANLIKNHSAEDVASFVRQTAASLYDALAYGVSSEGNWNANRIKEVIKSAIQIARYSHVVFTTPDSLAQAWDVERLRSIHVAIQDAERLKNTPSVLTLMKQFAMAIDPQVKAAQQSKKQEKQAARKRKLEEKTQQKATEDPVIEAPAKKAKTSAVKKSKKALA